MKRGRILVLFLSVVFLAASVAAAEITTTADSSTQIGVDISGADDLYAYEVNFSIDSGSVTDVIEAEFLGDSGSDATYGHNVKNDYLYAYGSRLDSSRTGIDGSGELFNITHTGGLTLKGHTMIDTSGNTEYTTYNADGTTTTTTVAGTGGGGGGGGGIPSSTTLPVSQSRSIVVIPAQGYSINVVLNQEERESITIRNSGNQQVSIRLETTSSLKNYIILDTPTFTLAPGEQRTVEFSISTDQRKLVTGQIFVVRNNADKIPIDVIINPSPENPLFDASVSIPFTLREMLIGENLVIDISLLQVRDIGEAIDVVANYVVRGSDGTLFIEESETFAVTGERDFSKELITAGLPPGKYVVGLEIVYPGAFAVSSAQFEIKEDKGLLSLDSNVFIIGAVVLAIIVAIVVSVWAVRKKPGIGRKKR